MFGIRFRTVVFIDFGFECVDDKIQIHRCLATAVFFVWIGSEFLEAFFVAVFNAHHNHLRIEAVKFLVDVPLTGIRSLGIKEVLRIVQVEYRIPFGVLSIVWGRINPNFSTLLANAIRKVYRRYIFGNRRRLGKGNAIAAKIQDTKA